MALTRRPSGLLLDLDWCHASIPKAPPGPPPVAVEREIDGAVGFFTGVGYVLLILATLGLIPLVFLFGGYR